MKFTRLWINNFLTIGADQSAKLDDRGLVLIQGCNEDDSSATSNGVGKSSIPDALCWALYGTTARGLSGDAVVNRTAKKDCVVQVELIDGEITYHISRHRKHSKCKNELRVFLIDEKAGPKDLTRGTERETQELVDEIMGCSLEVFQAAVYAGQERMPDLPGMTDKQLKVLIEEAAGVERLEAAYTRAREKALEASRDATERARQVDNLRVQLETEKDNHAQAVTGAVEFDEQRESRAQTKREEAAALKEELRTLVGELKKYDTEAISAELAEITAKLNARWEAEKKSRAMHLAYTNEQRLVDQAFHEHKEIREEIQEWKERYDDPASAMVETCEACGRPYDPTDPEEAKKHYAEKIKALVPQAKLKGAELKQLQEKLAGLKKAADDFDRENLPDLSKMSTRQTQLQEKLRKADEIRVKVKARKGAYDAAIARVDEILKETNPYNTLIDKAQKAIADYEARITLAQAALETSQKAEAVAQAVVKVFGPAGVRAHILDTVTPFLNERTAEYLAALSDGNISATWSTLATTTKGELKEKFNIEVTHAKGGDSFAAISGGEKRKVRLATMLALQDLVATRATKPIDLWIGDEIDDALDGAGLERLMGILERKARERGTVLVISHNDLADWIDDVCVVTKRGGQSVIEGALCGV